MRVSHSLKPIKGISQGKYVFVCLFVVLLLLSLRKYISKNSIRGRQAYSNICSVPLLHTQTYRSCTFIIEIIIGSELFRKSLPPQSPSECEYKESWHGENFKGAEERC